MFAWWPLAVLLLILGLSLLAAVLAVSYIFGLVLARGVPFVSSPRRTYHKIIQSGWVQPGAVVYDLGCGKSQLLIDLARACQAKGVGYEISLVPYLWSRWNIWRSRQPVTVLWRSYDQADLGQADVVFCYLFPERMKALAARLADELRPGSRVITYGFRLPDRPPTQVVTTNPDRPALGQIFLYQY